MEPIRIFVAHVKKGYEDRAAHMEKMLGDLGLDFTYMLDGDIPDLDDEWLGEYFTGDMMVRSPGASVATKHLLIYRTMVRENIGEALVLEDDIFLKKNFIGVLEKTREETAPMVAEGRPVWVGFEATCMKITPRSQRRKGQVVYKGESLQCTGAYYIDLPMARLILDTAAREKIGVYIDWYVDSLRSRGITDALYWSYPVVAEQGSHDGRMCSGIGNGVSRKSGPVWIKRLKRRLTMAYKEMIACFR